MNSKDHQLSAEAMIRFSFIVLKNITPLLTWTFFSLIHLIIISTTLTVFWLLQITPSGIADTVNDFLLTSVGGAFHEIAFSILGISGLGLLTLWSRLCHKICSHKVYALVQKGLP